MKKYFTLNLGVLVFAMAAWCLSATAQKTHSLMRSPSTNVVLNGNTVSKVGKAPSTSVNTKNYQSSLVKKSWSDGSTQADILLDEDFSAFTAGTEDVPDTKMVANYYGDPGMYIDKALTAQDTWAGCYVYSAGGKVALVSPNEYTGADLDTPLGDYSGDLTITFKVKALVNSDLFVNVLKGGYAYGLDANTKGSGNVSSYRLYASQGWAEITLKVSNYSSDPDGFIQFHNFGTLIIDNIKVTTTANFVASPEILPATNFTSTSFTANWSPVRKAFNYYLDLYKKVYTSDKDSTITADFENSDDSNILPSDWTLVQNGKEKLNATAGSNGSKGLILVNGDTLATPYDLAKYKTMSLWLHIYDPDPETNYEVYDTEVDIDVRTISGWENIGSFSPDGFFTGRSVNVIKIIGAGKYYGVRLRVSGLPEGDYVAIDDINATTGRPARLEAVEGDFPGYYYASTKNCTYTFKNLEPTVDYFYSVKTHYLLQYSVPELQFAFGVGAPDLLPATEITSSSYQANWSAASKATRYLVNNYGVSTASTDVAGNVVLDEDFSKVNASATSSTDPYNPEALGNDDEVSFDSYTNNAGWVGTGTTLCQGMIGAAAASQSNYIITPPLYLDNDDNFNLYVKAYGTTGEALLLQSNNKVYATYFTSASGDEKGTIDNTFTIPDRDKAQCLIFYTLGKTAFMLDAVKVTQNVKSGDKVYTWLSSQIVSGDTLNCTFTGLDKYGYSGYAYALTSYYDLDGETATSALNGYQPVTLSTATVINGSTDISNAGSLVEEVARYDANGVKVSAPVRGLNIVKLSNGKVIKLFIK
jgi:hypothetical protein